MSYVPESLAQQLAYEFVAKIKNAPISSQCEAFANVMRVIMTLNIQIVNVPDQIVPVNVNVPDQTDEEMLTAFCAEYIVKESGAELRLIDLMIAYKDWATLRGRKYLTKSRLTKFMATTFGKPISKGKVYNGIRLKEDE